jgi:Holliday junction resolvase RusA-like endonuclease
MTEVRKYRLIIPGKSVGKESVRVENRHGRIPEKSRNFMTAIKWICRAEKVEMLERCQVDIFICLPVRYKEANRRSPAMEFEPLKRADRDNILKACHDAMEGILYRNDSHIIWGKCGYLFIDHDQPSCTVILITERNWTNFRVRGSIEDFIQENDDILRSSGMEDLVQELEQDESCGFRL